MLGGDSSRPGPAGRWRAALRDPPLWIAVAFVVAGLVMRSLLPLGDSEAMQAQSGAALLERGVWEALFAMRLRPILALFYLPFGAIGPEAFFAAHVAVSGVAVLALGRTAQRLGSSGTVASLAAACTPFFLITAASGTPNTDGVAAVAVALYLYTRPDRQFLAGVVASLAPLVRPETAIYTLVLALYALTRRERRWRFLPGLLLVPTLFLSAGAIYHHDLLWWVHFRPNNALPYPGFDVARMLGSEAFGRSVLARTEAILNVLWYTVPLWPLALLWHRRLASPVERVFLASLAATTVAMVGVPLLGLAFFGLLPRYGLVWLPLVALAAARYATSAQRDKPPLRLALPLAALGLALALMVWRGFASIYTALVFALPLMAWSIPWRRQGGARARWVRGPALVLCLAALRFVQPEIGPQYWTSSSFQPPELTRALDWLGTHGEDGATIYTNVHDLAHALDGESADGLGGQRRSRFHVRFVVRMDMAYPFYTELNHDNGQYDRIITSLGPEFMGGPAWLCALERRQDLSGTLWVWSMHLDNGDFSDAYPNAFVACASEEVARFADISVRRGRPMPEGCPPEVPPEFRADFMVAPCRLMERAPGGEP